MSVIQEREEFILGGGVGGMNSLCSRHLAPIYIVSQLYACGGGLWALQPGRLRQGHREVTFY